MKTILSLTIIMLIIGCAGNPTKLTKEGELVDVLPGKASKSCSALGKVLGKTDNGIEQLATNHARNLAAKLGGDSLYVKEVIPNGNKIIVHGVAYKCN